MDGFENRNHFIQISVCYMTLNYAQIACFASGYAASIFEVRVQLTLKYLDIRTKIYFQLNHTIEYTV